MRRGEQVPREVNDWWHVAVVVTKVERRVEEKMREEGLGSNVSEVCDFCGRITREFGEWGE